MVLIFNSMGIKPESLSFFEKLSGYFQKHGHKVIFLSEKKIGQTTFIGNYWDLSKSKEYYVPTDCKKRALALLEVEKWQERLEYSVHQSTGDNGGTVAHYAGFVYKLYSTLKPDIVFTTGITSVQNGIPFQLAQKMSIPVYAFEKGFFTNTFILDPQGTDAHNSLISNGLNENEWNLTENQQIGGQFIKNINVESTDRWRERNKGDIQNINSEVGEKIKVLYLGLDMSNTGVFPEWHEDNKKIIRNFRNSIDVVNHLLGFNTVKLIYKPHPTLLCNPEKYFHALIDHSVIYTGDFIQAIQWADVVVCDGTTAEITCMMMQKPVLQIGNTYLSGRGCFYDANNFSELEEEINKAYYKTGFDEKVKRFNAFIGFIVTKYLVYIDKISTGTHHYISIESKLGEINNGVVVSKKQIQYFRYILFQSSKYPIAALYDKVLQKLKIKTK